ncbi:MAG: DUF2341 domain-containing protein [Kiritimatiellia bacterium]
MGIQNRTQFPLAKWLAAFAVLMPCIAPAVYMVHEFYLPLPEAQVLQAFNTLDGWNRIKAPMESVTSIVVTGPDTIVHYDHWEDGYEVDINNPAQPTTQIWGDGNDANGIPPGYASDPVGLPMGAVIPLRNNVSLPRNPSIVLYDARDRITASKALVISRALWSVSTGPVLAESIEVAATIDHGTHYVAPVGEDVSSDQMFEFVGLAVMADMDNTAVTIDKDGPGGAAPVTVTLNRGESHYVNGGVMTGAEVTATKPVQVHLLTGDVGSTYETRWYTLVPVEDWFSRYMSPVGTSPNGQPCYVFLYNHNAAPITVNAVSRVGSESLTVEPGETLRWQMPQNSGAMFTSAGGEPFFAVATVGANRSANDAHDWGFTLMPQDALSSTAVVGWGPGSSDMSRNGSPVFVSPARATRIYVDYNGDGQGSLTDPNGGKYDKHYDLAALQSQTIFDPDGDQTAMRIYTTDGALFTAAWGQDPATALPWNPYLDMGSTVLPLPEPKIIKSSRLVSDIHPDGPSIGDTLEYRIEVDNKGLLPLGNTVVLDTLPPQLQYVPNSTTLDGEPLPDNHAPATPFPLDAPGYTIPIILRAGTSVFTYRTLVVGPGSIVNRGAVPQYEIYDDTETEVLPGEGSHPSVVRFVDAGGNDVEVYPEGDDIYLWFTDADANRNPDAVETITLLVRNETTGDYEFITLTETGEDTGVFTTTTPLPSSPSSGLDPEDGVLHARAGDELTVNYVDPIYGDWCSDTATLSVISAQKKLYLTEPAEGAVPDPEEPGNPEDPPAPVSYYKRQITFNNSTRNEDLKDFPVLVTLTSADFDFAKVKSDGSNIRFYDADGTTPLSYEIESWNPAAGEAHVWVKVPQIDKLSDTDSIWMHYGNPALADAQSPAAVWSSGFEAVWHMDEVTGTTVSDSTGNGWDGTANASVVLNASGQINGADAYPDGVQGYTRLDKTGAIVPVRNSPFTFESWLHVEPNSNYDRVFAQAVSGRHLQVIRHGGIVQVGRSDGSSIDCPLKGAATVPANRSWFHFAWVFNGSSDTLYINGKPNSTSTTPHQGAQVSSLGQNYIGARDSSNFPFGGKLDEMRISGTARSAGWVDAQYAAMSGAFSVIGAEQSDGQGTSPAPAADEWLYKRKLTFDNGTRSEALRDFPVLVTLTADNFDFAKAQGDGQDIRFYDADGTTPLSYEIESWDMSAQQAHIWVKVPQIDALSGTDGIWMFYGNSAASDAQSAGDVWSNGFEAVWHMDETSGAVADSTGNGWNGTPAGVVRDTETKINGADSYPVGVSSYTALPSGNIIGTGETVTFEGWIRNYYPESAWQDRIFTHEAAGRKMQVSWTWSASHHKIDVARFDGSSPLVLKKSVQVPRDGWFHFVWVKNGTTDTLYVNGETGIDQAVDSGFQTTTTDGSYIGSLSKSSCNFDGALDEMRVSSVARSADWISAQYASMNGTFVGMGDEQENAPPAIENALDRIDPAAIGDTTTVRSEVLSADGGWSYKKQLTFLNASRAENLDNFPVLVHLTSANFDFAKAQGAGQDIRFYDADGTTALAYEIESWDAAAQQAHIWVKVPRIDASSSTDSIWMEYGNPAAADAQSPSAVWNSGFEAVWHMDETSGATVADSTANARNGVPTGVALDTAGQINGADGFGGTSRTRLPGVAIVPVTGSFTFESWVYVGSSANFDRIFTQDTQNRQCQVLWNAGKLEVGRNETGGSVNSIPGKKGATVPSGKWFHFVWVKNGSTDTLYVDGAAAANANPYSSMALGDGNNYIGTRAATTANFDGRLDEMRISSVARSANWVSAQYAAMTDAFISFGHETAIPAENVARIAFTQLPCFCSDFTMPAGGNLSASVFVAAVDGAMPVNPAISARLKYDGATFATLGAPTAQLLGPGEGGEGIYRLDWSTVLGGKVTIPAGEAVTLEITSADRAPFAILYDSEDYPSFVSLPADTIIKVESLAVFDAPYPDGSPVDTVIAGTTAYMRATVSDPFGAYDITGLTLAIPEMGVDMTLDDTAVVHTTLGTKTYEFSCCPPPAAGSSLSITVTAHEGTEGITNVAATRIHVSADDFGTPSTTEFTIDNNGEHTEIYQPDQTVHVRVTDLDQNTNPDEVETITVTITTSSGDTETITLYETGTDTGVFTGGIPASATTDGGDGDGTLYAPPGTVLDVVYVDPDDPTDTSSDTAIVTQPPGTPGIGIQKQLADPSVSTVGIGSEVVYRVRVFNTGTTTLDPVVLTDGYPAGLRFVSAEPAPTSHDSTNRVVTWSNIGPLAPRGIREFELTFEALAAGNSVINTATATYPGGSQSDDASVTIVDAGHTVTKTLLSPSPAGYGEIVEYRIVVQNTGNTRITSIPLEDAFSAAYLDYVPGSATFEPDGIGAGALFWENIAAPDGLAAGGAITNDLKFKVVGAGNPVVNTAAADYSVDEYDTPVPPARDSDTNLVSTAGLISGHVWNDLNRNADGDAGEPRLPGVEIRLYDTNGVLVATTTTLGEDGYYEFPNLPDGTYTVVEVDPPGYGSTGDADGINDNSITVTVANGSVHPNRDFYDYRLPFDQQASISGTVWHDENRDGTVDPGERGIPGVTVALYKDVNNNGEYDAGDRFVRFAFTDLDGGYAFSALEPGNYIVVETDLPGYMSTGDVVNPNDNQIPVSVNAGDHVTGRDFLDAKIPARLYGYAFLDLDDSLTKSPADSVLNEVDVRLYMNGIFVATTTTDENGFYEFNHLPPGNYDVRFSSDAGALVDLPAVGTPAAGDPHRQRATNAVDHAVAHYTLYPGHGIGDNAGEPVNVGYKPAEDAATIGDRVWNDANANGIQDDGEPGIEGVVVKIYRVADDGAGGLETNLVATTTTDANGNYLFQVPPGDYLLRVDAPDGYSFSPKNANGGTPETDSDFGENGPHSNVITLMPNEVNLDLDAGLYSNPTLSVITSFRAFAEDGTVFVEWETAAEYDTIGYWVDRLEGGVWTRLNPEAPVWSEMNGHPTLYTLADPGAEAGGCYTWRVVEIEGSGRENLYGPYTVFVDGPAADFDSWAGEIDWAGAASGRDDDPDGDGLTNFEEFLAGTDPLQANSVLKILGIRPVAGGIEIRWASVAGKVYAIEHARTLGDPWLPVKTGHVADGSVSRFVLPGADGGFFRVVLTAEP